MKWLCLLTESTTTIVALKLCELGSSTIKSMLTMSHLTSGIGSGQSLPEGLSFLCLHAKAHVAGIAILSQVP
jgi:hypothetical protein